MKIGDRIDYSNFPENFQEQLKEAINAIVPGGIIRGTNIIITPDGKFPNDVTLFSMVGTVSAISESGDPEIQVEIVSKKYMGV